MWTNDGERIFIRYGLGLPSLIRKNPSSPLGTSVAQYVSPFGGLNPCVKMMK